MMNNICIMGRLTRDPELRHTQGNVANTSFTLAVERDVKSKDGAAPTVDFIDFIAWRSEAESICANFKKGQMMSVIGRLQVHSWTDKNDFKRRSVQVVVTNAYPCNAAEVISDSDAPFTELTDLDDLPEAFR